MRAASAQLASSLGGAGLPISDKTKLITASPSLGRVLETDLQEVGLPFSRVPRAGDLGCDTAAGARRVVQNIRPR
eukprot:5411960-Pyramimonas_sp.AAC.1